VADEAGRRIDPETTAYCRPGGPSADDPDDEDTFDRRPERIGSDQQRARQWPDDPNTLGFITRRARLIPMAVGELALAAFVLAQPGSRGRR
jgi:hypothetical protein